MTFQCIQLYSTLYRCINIYMCVTNVYNCFCLDSRIQNYPTVLTFSSEDKRFFRVLSVFMFQNSLRNEQRLGEFLWMTLNLILILFATELYLMEEVGLDLSV